MAIMLYGHIKLCPEGDIRKKLEKIAKEYDITKIEAWLKNRNDFYLYVFHLGRVSKAFYSKEKFDSFIDMIDLDKSYWYAEVISFLQPSKPESK
jgi:hypothetical protein